MNAPFAINPYRSTDFIYEGSKANEVEAAHDISDRCFIQERTLYAGSPIFTATFIGSIVLFGPLGGILFGSVVGTGLALTPVPFSEMHKHCIDTVKLSQLHARSKDIFGHELTRIDKINELARSFLGLLGESKPYPSNPKFNELAALEKEVPSYSYLNRFSIREEFLRYRKIRHLREQIWNEKLQEVNDITKTIFEKIQARQVQKAEYLKKVESSKVEDLSPKPSCLPGFPLPRLELTSVEALESHFRTLQDLQSLALAILQISHQPIPELKDQITLSHQAKERADWYLAEIEENKIFNTLYQTATSAIKKEKHELKLLHSVVQSAQTSKDVKQIGEGLKAITDFICESETK